MVKYAVTKGGKKMATKLIKKGHGYYLYLTVEGHKELWRGTIDSKNGYRAGYVMDSDNFDIAVEVAKEEMASLMAGAV